MLFNLPYAAYFAQQFVILSSTFFCFCMYYTKSNIIFRQLNLSVLTINRLKCWRLKYGLKYSPVPLENSRKCSSYLASKVTLPEPTRSTPKISGWTKSKFRSYNYTFTSKEVLGGIKVGDNIKMKLFTEKIKALIEIQKPKIEKKLFGAFLAIC